jgi:hypothetical protein
VISEDRKPTSPHQLISVVNRVIGSGFNTFSFQFRNSVRGAGLSTYRVLTSGSQHGHIGMMFGKCLEFIRIMVTFLESLG